jgi:acyl transferase domain-containing protein
MNPKNSIWMFPGTDALEDPALRAQAWTLPEVRARISEAEMILADSAEKAQLDLPSFMMGPNQQSKRWLHQLAVATVPVQVGLFERQLKASGAPGLLIGCSLGDVARSVCAGAISFESGVVSVYNFVRHTTELQGGAVIHVRSENDFSPAFFESVKAHGLELSVSQTPRHCLIAGPAVMLDLWARTQTEALGVKVRPMYPFPIHTQWMSPVLDKIFRNIIRACDGSQWKIPMFSTIHCKPIVSQVDLFRDTMDNIVSAVRWSESITQLVRSGYDHFVNIGPAPTLIGFIRNSKVPASVRAHDAFAKALPLA